MNLLTIIIIGICVAIVLGVLIIVAIFNYRFEKRKKLFFKEYPKKKEFMIRYEQKLPQYFTLTDDYYDIKTKLTNEIEELRLCPEEFKSSPNSKITKLKQKYIQLKIRMDKYREDKELYLRYYNEMINFCKGK